MSQTQTQTQAYHLRSLEDQLGRENPVLVDAIARIRELDRIAHRMGVLPRDESFAMRISWWPLVSILGTFSAGKSSFINHYLGEDLQRTGTQAVDERFTVICFGKEQGSKVLPGVSLDADVRFPFYRISKAIEKVAPGEGRRIDAYVQLKTSGSANLKGKIFIDSPGFDADRQRDAILRITEHIIDLSDLVLVFFDARHPEPGAMRDTLQHLVAQTLGRADVGKFVFILNQMDSTARENNPEDVVAAWQRAMGEAGFAGSDFYFIFNPTVSLPIQDEQIRQQFESKRDRHLAKIYERLDGVDVARSYRIVGTIESIARSLSDSVAPRLMRAVTSWRRLVLGIDAALLLLVLVAAIWFTISRGYWDGLRFAPPWWDSFNEDPLLFWGVLGAVLIVAWLIHRAIRRQARRFVRNRLIRERAREQAAEGVNEESGQDIVAGFERSTRGMRSVWSRRPAGFRPRHALRVQEIAAGSHELVQKLNDHYADPAGGVRTSPGTVSGVSDIPTRV